MVPLVLSAVENLSPTPRPRSEAAAILLFGFASNFILCYPVYMSQDQLIKLVHKATGEIYWTRKNKRKVERKIELKKYSKKLRKRVVFKETKK